MSLRRRRNSHVFLLFQRMVSKFFSSKTSFRVLFCYNIKFACKSLRIQAMTKFLLTFVGKNEKTYTTDRDGFCGRGKEKQVL